MDFKYIILHHLIILESTNIVEHAQNTRDWAKYSHH